MKTTVKALSMLLLAAAVSFAQDGKDAAKPAPSPTPAATPTAVAATPAKITITAQSTPLELAQAAQNAHGGDKFRGLRSISMRGSADISAPGSTQTMGTTFYVVTAGDQSRFELTTPLAPITQIFDGTNLYNSFQQIQIPPMSRLSISLLQKVGEKGYSVSALPDKKKKRAFRISTPDGYATDFYIDAATGLVDSIEAKFAVNGRDLTTAISQDKYRAVDGLMVPEKFSQRMDFGGNAFYASFKAREILVNSELPENTFVIPQ